MGAIEVRDLRKNYGSVAALRGISLTVGKGEIYGLLGQNGAGKTTLVKILLSIVRATAGRAALLDREVPHPESRRRVGYLPEDHRFPEYHTGAGLLDFLGALSGMPGAERRRRIPEVLDTVSLRDKAGAKIRTYSKGMRQRLGIAQAILHDPDVVFLDEPTDGVDPLGRVQIRDLILRLKQQGKTVFINSHLLNEVEMISDRVGILSDGVLVREGRVEDLTRATPRWDIRLEGPFEAALEELRREFPSIRAVPGGISADLESTERLNALIDRLRAKDLRIAGVARATLEDVFKQAVQP